MNLEQARASAMAHKDGCTRHITVSIRATAPTLVRVGAGGPEWEESKYEVDPNGFAVSDWYDGSVVETYCDGERR